jgi:choline kinase
MSKPLHIFKAALSGRYYASRSMKQISHMHMVCTGKKEDVTQQVEALIAETVAQDRAEEREAARGLVEALRKVEAAIFNDNGDVTYSPLGIASVVKDALATYNDNRKG